MILNVTLNGQSLDYDLGEDFDVFPNTDDDLRRLAAEFTVRGHYVDPPYLTFRSFIVERTPEKTFIRPRDFGEFS